MSDPLRVLRLTEDQLLSLRNHLFPGDGWESVALALCGTRLGKRREIYSIHEIHLIPAEACALRTPSGVRWPLEPLIPLLEKAIKRNLSLLKIHSHPEGFEMFSTQDDKTDKQLAHDLGRILEREITHVSAFMTPAGNVHARIVQTQGGSVQIDRVAVTGDDIAFDGIKQNFLADDADLRTRQAFGEGTTALLKSLSVGVVGCSGTGSWVAEMLARLGVGHLVLIDPDRVERKNLNRIVQSTGQDAQMKRFKVEMMRDAVTAMDLNTSVEIFPHNLARRDAVEALAECDVVFGCVDSADGRELLNRIAAYYLIPYFDIGVRLDADGKGGIQQACCAIHYLIPGGSSLLSRGVITSEQVNAQALQRADPKQYAALEKEGYIKGAAVDRPAVVSINGFAASHAVNELLARIHPYRRDPNAEYRWQTFSLSDGAWLRVTDGASCNLLSRHVGKGDTVPLLGNPALS
jgi:hypothetical protein